MDHKIARNLAIAALAVVSTAKGEFRSDSNVENASALLGLEREQISQVYSNTNYGDADYISAMCSADAGACVRYLNGFYPNQIFINRDEKSDIMAHELVHFIMHDAINRIYGPKIKFDETIYSTPNLCLKYVGGGFPNYTDPYFNLAYRFNSDSYTFSININETVATVVQTWSLLDSYHSSGEYDPITFEQWSDWSSDVSKPSYIASTYYQSEFSGGELIGSEIFYNLAAASYYDPGIRSKMIDIIHNYDIVGYLVLLAEVNKEAENRSDEGKILWGAILNNDIQGSFPVALDIPGVEMGKGDFSCE